MSAKPTFIYLNGCELEVHSDGDIFLETRDGGCIYFTVDQLREAVAQIENFISRRNSAILEELDSE